MKLSVTVYSNAKVPNVATTFSKTYKGRILENEENEFSKVNFGYSFSRYIQEIERRLGDLGIKGKEWAKIKV